MNPATLEEVGQGLGGEGQGATVMGGRAQAPRLGLGLGLNKFRRADLLQAQEQGGPFMEQFSRRHPGIMNRIERGIEAGGERGAAIQNFMDTGATPTGAEVRFGPRPRPGTPSMEQLQRPQPLGPGMEPRVPTPEELARPEPSRQDLMAEARAPIREARQGMQAARQGMRQARQQFRQQRRGMR
jgi:hypothetical protein